MKVSESITTLIQELVKRGKAEVIKPYRYVSRAEQRLWNGNFTRPLRVVLPGSPAASLPDCLVFEGAEDTGDAIGGFINGLYIAQGRSAVIIHEGVYELTGTMSLTRGSAVAINAPDCVVVGDGEVVFKLKDNFPLGADGRVIALELLGEGLLISGIKIDANKAGNPNAVVTGVKIGNGVCAENFEFVDCDEEVLV